MGLEALGIGGIVKAVGEAADALFTSDEERLKAALADKELDVRVATAQMEVNKAEAAHRSVFVAGWRPFIGWVAGCALAYQFVLYPLALWPWALLQAHGYIASGLKPPPLLDVEQLLALVSAMLGIAGMRTFEKTKGKAA